MPSPHRWKRNLAAVGVVALAALVPVRAQTPCEPCAQARALRADGKCKEAIPLLKKAAKADKGSAEIQGLLVMCDLELRKPLDAGAALTKFLANGPTTEQLREVRGVVSKSAPQPPERQTELRTPEGAEPALVVSYSSATVPPESRDVRIGSAVEVRATIATDGTARRIEPRINGNISMGQFAEFEEAAATEMRRWRFFPALLEGRPVESELRVFGIFELIE